MILTDIKQDNAGLRQYQIKAKKDIYQAWDKYDRVMLQMPTATGKTRVFSSIIKDLRDSDRSKYILVLAHREELIEQISKNLNEYDINHGFIKSGYNQTPWLPVQVASVQTLSRRLANRDRKPFDIIIVDEAHHILANSYKEICAAFPKAKLLGVTATPYRLNAEPFTPMFSKLICTQTVSEFIKQKYLSHYIYYSIQQDSYLQKRISNVKINKTTGDYDEKDLVELFDNKKILANIVDTYEKYANGKKGIVYTINKAHNEHVCQNFRDGGHNAVAIDCDTPLDERKALVEDFRKGKIDILCNVNIFTEGFDCPDVEFIQLARPTVSLSLYLQQVGRGLRIHANKSQVIFLDNVGMVNRFGSPSMQHKWQEYFEGKHLCIDYQRNNPVSEDNKIKPLEEEGDAEVIEVHNSMIDSGIIVEQFPNDHLSHINDYLITGSAAIKIANNAHGKLNRYWDGYYVDDETVADIINTEVPGSQCVNTNNELRKEVDDLPITNNDHLSNTTNGDVTEIIPAHKIDFDIAGNDDEIINNDDKCEINTRQELDRCYHEIDTFKKYNQDIPADLLQKCDEYENDIIREEIIASLEKILSGYKPIRKKIKLSICSSTECTSVLFKDEIYDIKTNSADKIVVQANDDEKNSEDKEKNILYVDYNGQSFYDRIAKNTFVKVIETIGCERVSKLGINCRGENLVSLNKSKYFNQQCTSDSYYITTHSSTEQKRSYLIKIAQKLNLALRAEIKSTGTAELDDVFNEMNKLSA